MSKKETVEEFLQRGGSITVCPPGPIPEEAPNKVVSTTGANASMMSLAEGSLFYSESKAKPKERKKPVKPLNVSALPACLLKFVPRG